MDHVWHMQGRAGRLDQKLRWTGVWGLHNEADMANTHKQRLSADPLSLVRGGHAREEATVPEGERKMVEPLWVPVEMSVSGAAAWSPAQVGMMQSSRLVLWLGDMSGVVPQDLSGTVGNESSWQCS